MVFLRTTKQISWCSPTLRLMTCWSPYHFTLRRLLSIINIVYTYFLPFDSVVKETLNKSVLDTFQECFLKLCLSLEFGPARTGGPVLKTGNGWSDYSAGLSTEQPQVTCYITHALFVVRMVVRGSAQESRCSHQQQTYKNWRMIGSPVIT